MDWISALCLSIPPSVAFLVATRMRRNDLKWALLTFARNINDGAVAIAEKMRKSAASTSSDRMSEIALLSATVRDASAALADAHVRAAKYQARAIRVQPKAVKPGEPSIFEKWLARGGSKFPQSVIDSVDWAIGRLRGTEMDDPESDNGDEAGAHLILAQYAPGLEELIAAEVRAGK